ncbi:MAG: ATP-binding protein [Nitrososphaerota archaeon]|nr:ATP-binding protein [Nitrososphaerota archaeon]
MLCVKCKDRYAEVSVADGRLRLCPECFTDYFERRVREAVEKYHMFNLDERVAVAVSGGKDSGALLRSLRRAFPNLDIVALHINLGIEGYSDHCESKVRALVREEDVDLHVFRLIDEGFTIDDFRKTIYKNEVCSPCGIVKRHLLDKMALEVGAKVLATGHNLDDVLSTLLHTFFSGDFVQLVRLKPVLIPKHPYQTKKVKPLIKLSEFEDYQYALYTEIPIRTINCPHSIGTKSREGKKILDLLSEGNPNFRYQALSLFLKKLIPMIEDRVERPELRSCIKCGFPSSAEVCAYCKRVEMVKKVGGRG